MKYYKLNYTNNLKIRGCSEVIKDYKYHGDVYNPKFIGNIHYEKVDFLPVPVNPILFAKANTTDLIEGGGMLSGKLLISTNLKSLLERKDFGVQYFQNSVIQKDKEILDYWVVNPYLTKNELINFENAEVIKNKKKIAGGTEKVILTVTNLEQLNLEKTIASEKLESVTITKFSLGVAIEDFFAVRHVTGGIAYIVSENLKSEIEDKGCTGIEFQPTELSYDEWTSRDGPRDSIYGRSW